MVTILVGDDNDNSPQFQYRSYYGEVEENVLPYTSVLSITASDADKDENAQIR